MKSAILLAALPLTLLSLPATAQTEVAAYQPGVTTDGITYFLPRTCLRVAVTARHTRHEPGEFCAYAERYLRLKGVTQTAYDTWTIEKVEIVPYGEADKTEAYSIKFKTKTSAPLVGLAKDGRLLSINTKAEDEKTLPTESVTPEETKTLNASDYKTAEILAAGSVAKMAELTANEIYDIRENRSALTKGQADFMPKDGEQLRLMLASLDTQEEALLQLFQGTEKSETCVLIKDFAPEGETDRALLFRFSKYLGMVDDDDMAGSPVYISLKDKHTLPAVAESDGKQKKEVEDLRYRVPSAAEVSVFTDTQTLASRTIPMAQFGRTEHLGGELFNKKYTTTLQFDPTTGGITRITGEEAK